MMTAGRGEDRASRRAFLASGTLAAAGMAMSSEASDGAQGDRPARLPEPVELPGFMARTEKASGGTPTALAPADRVGYAIVGLGRLALEQILPAFGSCRRSKPVALVSGDRAKATKVARQYGIAEAKIYDYASYDRLRDDPAVDAIYIVLPNAMHVEFTERGAAAGKHILCEKPMATSARDCERMIAACKAASRTLMIAYRSQYEPHHRALIASARKREFGPLRMIASHNIQNQGDPGQWRHRKAMAGGGSLPDIGIYCLNAARYITGEEPVEVSATIASDPSDPRFREVEDRIAFSLRFPSGVLATALSGYSAHESRSLRVLAETGWYDMDPAFSYRGLRLRTARAEGPEELVTERKIDDADQFALEIDHMSRCLVEGRVPRTPGEEGLQDQRIMDALYQSAREGRSVAIPRVEGLDVTRGPALD